MDWMTDPIYRNLDIYWQSMNFWMQLILSCLTLGALLLSLYSAWQSRKSVQIAKEALEHEKESFKKLHTPNISIVMTTIIDSFYLRGRKKYKVCVEVYIKNKGHTIEYPTMAMLEFPYLEDSKNQDFFIANNNPKMLRDIELLPGTETSFQCDFYIEKLSDGKYHLSLYENFASSDIITDSYFKNEIRCIIFFARGFNCQNNSLGTLEVVKMQIDFFNTSQGD